MLIYSIWGCSVRQNRITKNAEKGVKAGGAAGIIAYILCKILERRYAIEIPAEEMAGFVFVVSGLIKAGLNAWKHRK